MATPNQLDNLFIPDEEQKEDRAKSSEDLFIPDEASQEAQESPENLFIPDEGVEVPTRAGAIGRAVAEEFLPTTVAGLTARGLGTLPVPAVPKFLLGATGAILSYGAAGRLQEQAARMIAGDKAVEEFKAQRQRDIAEYPVSTFAASAATPTAGGIAALGR